MTPTLARARRGDVRLVQATPHGVWRLVGMVAAGEVVGVMAGVTIVAFDGRTFAVPSLLGQDQPGGAARACACCFRPSLRARHRWVLSIRSYRLRIRGAVMVASGIATWPSCRHRGKQQLTGVAPCRCINVQFITAYSRSRSPGVPSRCAWRRHHRRVVGSRAVGGSHIPLALHTARLFRPFPYSCVEARACTSACPVEVASASLLAPLDRRGVARDVARR